LDEWLGSDSVFFFVFAFVFLVTTTGLGDFLAGLPIVASFLSTAFDIEKVGKLGEFFSLGGT
jgi:hypothetical protein